MYGLNEDSESICLVVRDFTPYVYIELPDTGVKWTADLVSRVCSVFDDKLASSAPVDKTFISKKKLYHAHPKFVDGEITSKKFPFLKLSFESSDDIYALRRILYRKINIPGIGTLGFKMHESDAKPDLQFRCKKKVKSAGWVKFKGTRVEGEDKLTICDYEYNVSQRNIQDATEDPRLSLVVPKPRVLSIDAEVNSTVVSAMPDAEKPGDKVFQISLVLATDINRPETYAETLLSLGKPTKDKVGANVRVVTYKTEADLLVGFAEYITATKPNVITGYNIIGFDFNYMIGRADSLGVLGAFSSQGFLREVECSDLTINWSSNAFKSQKYKILDTEGIVYLDLLVIVMRDYKFNNYKLKTVSEFFLGETKDDLDHKDIFKCYRMGMEGGTEGNDALALCGKYCMQDSRLVMKMFGILQTWIGNVELAKICNITMFALYTQGQQIRVYSQVYYECMYNGTVVESGGYPAKSKLVGATVIDPQPGHHHNVVPFDFSSLYPSIMIRHNIDYTTLLMDNSSVPLKFCNQIKWSRHINCDCAKSVPQYEKGRKKPTRTKLVICEDCDYRFIKKEHYVGVLPRLLENLLNARKITKAENKELYKKRGDYPEGSKERENLETMIVVLDKRQLAIKISANSVYGSTGVKKGYLPFWFLTVCVTAMGRESLGVASEFLQKECNAKIVYGDTDSTMVQFEGFDTTEELWDHCLMVEKKVEEIFVKPMKLEFEEKIYKQFFIITKKRYMATVCGRDGVVDDTIMKKGVMTARRDNCSFNRRVYDNMIQGVFAAQEKEDLLESIVNTVLSLLQKGVKVKQLVITKSVGTVDKYKNKPLPEDETKLLKKLSELWKRCNFGPLPRLVKDRKEILLDEGVLHTLTQAHKLMSLPAQVQLAERMRARGMRVDDGSRLEYIILDTGIPLHKQGDKLESPDYFRERSSILRIDYLYYVKLLINPIDQVLGIKYGLGEFMKDFYDQLDARAKAMELISSMSLARLTEEE
jgi:DNA polymerase elongation subunit (family B)